jgi:hypothetical protein
VPNRRRRKLSTAMSAVAALAVASPCAYFLVYESTASNKPPSEHHEFKRAAVIADLPSELMSALTQGLSQFGINLPPIPALGGSGTSSPGLTSPGLTSPGLGSPGLTSPGLGSPGLTSPGLTSPGLTSPGLMPGTTTPGLTTPSTALTPTPGTGLTTPNPALTSPAGIAPSMGSPTVAPGEVPITSPAGLDPGADGTYPILGDPSTLGGGGLPQTSPAASTGSTGGGGLINDLMQAANQLGASQAIDLLKGLVMPAIMQGVQNGGAAAPAGGLPGAALPTGGLPGAALPTGGLPGAALPTGGLPGAALPAGGLPAAAFPPVAPPVPTT